MNEGWLEDRLGLLSNMYITLMQGEVDRFQDTVRMLKDYYKGMEGKIPEEFSPEYARIPLIDVIQFSFSEAPIFFIVVYLRTIFLSPNCPSGICSGINNYLFKLCSVITRFLCVTRWRQVLMHQEVVKAVPQGLVLFPKPLLRPRLAGMYRPPNHALHQGRGREREVRLIRLSPMIRNQNKCLTSQGKGGEGGGGFTVLISASASKMIRGKMRTNFFPLVGCFA